MEKLHILTMLKEQKRIHISFHTPGHKKRGADITELSYSDNLSDPRGIIAEAEGDVSRILGAKKSFLLTDGSTSGVFSMLYALRASGGKSFACASFSHPSVFHAAKALSLAVVPLKKETSFGLPQPLSEEELMRGAKCADALLLTSPDYYGFCERLGAARAICTAEKKPLLIDGAHGSHLRFFDRYAGKYADLWVDGVHKSLPALTQGAVVSARTEAWVPFLREGVRTFRTTSPSYPILASVEYAVKYPRNEAVERLSEAFKAEYGCVKNDDWSKILVPFGDKCDQAQKFLEQKGVYCEFNDGNYLMFYLSPCTKPRELKKLGSVLRLLPRSQVRSDAPCGQIPMYDGDGQ